MKPSRARARTLALVGVLTCLLYYGRRWGLMEAFLLAVFFALYWYLGREGWLRNENPIGFAILTCGAWFFIFYLLGVI